MQEHLSDELRALTEAGISLTSQLSLDAVLQKLVDVARQQVHARYGAMSVLGPEGGIQQFLTSGISEDERARIHHLPRGEGLLGIILKEGVVLRLDDISSDPRSAGFPANHPPMRSLLGVPVISFGRIIGNLYLTEREDGHPFSERDEEVVRLLATQAAVAVHNAQLYNDERRRAEEWKALFEVGREVAASPDLEALLVSIVRRARALLHTDVSALMLLTGDGTALRMAAHEGLRTTAMTELRLLAEHGLQGYTLETLRPTVVIDYQSDVRLRHRPAKLVADEGLTSQIAVPLVGREGPRGTLTVGNRRRTEFTERDAELLDAFGRWAAVAIETSELYDRLQSLARLEERDRIGMDLHDGVIQSIYAVGLHLEACLDQLDESPARLKPALEKAMDDLNRVIKDIRSYIFDLRPQVSSVSDLPRALRQLLEDVRLNALIAGELEVEGDVGELIDETRALALFHIAQEALNNVVKHSRASRVRVRLAVTGNSVELVVEDDGAGFEVDEGGARDRHGLRNIRDRARSIGADLALESTPGKGTLVRVELPVPRAERVT